MKTIQAIRGMHDILPGETPLWQHVEATARSLLAEYGFGEIRTPLVERSELFRRSIGEVTDIVEKEMYTFADRGGESLSLRPEYTAGCVRAAIEHGLLRSRMQKVWALGPMFRHERPQQGRTRQFHQVDAEIFGVPGPVAEAELIALSRRLWQRLQVEGLTLALNTLGNRAAREAYRRTLTAYFQDHKDALDEDSRRRLDTNPLRILDSKQPALQALVQDAPRIQDHLDAESGEHFQGLLHLLDEMGIPYRVNHRLVRGLDYYTRTVFEWVSDELGAQSAVCGGGAWSGSSPCCKPGPFPPRHRLSAVTWPYWSRNYRG